ncbi:type ISP restriction/modification enzyme, partial [Burkholderia multivorans]
LRKCLADEFSSIYVFHLRGNQRTSGELSRKEGGKIFGGGSRAPIAISILVKNPNAAQHGQIYFHDIGDYLSREEKLEKIGYFGSIAGIAAADEWLVINPDQHGDWLRQRDDRFGEYIVLGDKRGDATKLFENFSQGVLTARDSWCYNASKSAVATNMGRMIAFYRDELARFNRAHVGLDKKGRAALVDDFIDTSPTRISWTRALKQDVAKGRDVEYSPNCLMPSLYRPFTKQWLYFSRDLNEYVYQMPRIFPDATSENRVIMVKQRWTGEGQLALMIDRVVEFQVDGGTQCFPLFLYDEPEQGEVQTAQVGLFDSSQPMKCERKRRDGLTDEGLTHFQAAYPGERITKEDIFYYVYGLLHSPDYRERYADNLSKELPRIPCVKTAADFWAFSKAGRKLADLHVNYETVEMYPLQIKGGGLLLTDADYRVEKMRYAKNGKDKDLTTLIYNDKITVTGVPLEAYEYVVNGKPALDWVVERQCVKVDKDSGIINDANDYA